MSLTCNCGAPNGCRSRYYGADRCVMCGADWPKSTPELERRNALSIGDLVWYDTMQGSVPCRIVDTLPPLRFDHDDRLLLKVTGGHHPAYPRGLTFGVRRGPFVRQRDAIR